jgi:hypothetical protein
MTYGLYEVVFKKGKGIKTVKIGDETFPIDYAIGTDGMGPEEIHELGGREVVEIREIAKIEVYEGSDFDFVKQRLEENPGKLELFLI